jgi:hypothetical protein
MNWQKILTGSIEGNEELTTVQQELSAHGTNPVQETSACAASSATAVSVLPPETSSLLLAQQDRENSATLHNEVKSRPCL